MKLPAFGLFLAIGIVLATAWAIRTSAQETTQDPPGDGFVMGEDFTTLLSNPSLELKVERVDGTVYFTWTSTNPARLNEVHELGLYMQAMKEALEMRSDDRRDPTGEQIRTAQGH